ncbi:hypothetical protein BJX70DRAFT_355796 [Aspergillus crustosus]
MSRAFLLESLCLGCGQGHKISIFLAIHVVSLLNLLLQKKAGWNARFLSVCFVFLIFSRLEMAIWRTQDALVYASFLLIFLPQLKSMGLQLMIVSA